MPSDSFLQQAVPALEHVGVRMADGQGMSTSSSGLSDIFNQVAVHHSAGDFCTIPNNVYEPGIGHARQTEHSGNCRERDTGRR